MRYKLLGHSGLRVSELSLGTMTFGDDWGWGAPQAECRKIFEAYAAQGGNFIDCANNYTNGSAEKIIGELVAAERERFVVSSKFTLCQRPGDPNACGNQRKNMMQAVEASLKRLKTDYIDLYWVHAWDYLTPVEEVMRGLDDLVRMGKVLYVGISDTPAWVVAQANTLADLRGWSRFVGVQFPYNLLEREPEGDLLTMARAFDITAVTWGALSSGKLTGKHSGHTQGETKRRWWSQVPEREQAIIGEVVKIAGEIGRTPSQVAITWVRQQQGRASIIPVLGARTAEQMQDNLGCLDFALADDQLARLEALSAPELGFPHDFLAADSIRGLVYGDTYDRLDRPRG